ncbi:TetR/AcrR family transcriptional regulator [Lachnospiraceae bacterium 46-15]
MPPAKKFQREDIVKAAYEIVKAEGMKDMNARRIAKELGCSTQPIYHNFNTMEELKQLVRDRIYADYVEYMAKGAKEERAYLGMGMAFIRFARDYPNFFRVLFMHESGLSLIQFIQSDATGNQVLEKGQIFSELDAEQQKEFHRKVMVFTYGLAVIAATQAVQLPDEEIRELLASTTKELLVGFRYMQNQEDD